MSLLKKLAIISLSIAVTFGLTSTANTVQNAPVQICGIDHAEGVA